MSDTFDFDFGDGRGSQRTGNPILTAPPSKARAILALIEGKVTC